NANNNANNNQAALALSADVIQTGSQQDGNNPPAAGQIASATDKANFIDFCKGKTLTNGKQVKTGSCNGIPMGNIPSENKMISSVFISPKNGDNFDVLKDFNAQVQISNLDAGHFTNAATTYYSAPQDLNANGQIIGHTHITIQDTGKDLNPIVPMNPGSFVFFKGINDAGNGNGLLAVPVAGGLPAGNYRACSMTSASNHQPVNMPVAQRGAQDDCVRFTVGGGAGNQANQGN
ncbi:Uncharacterized protein TCAP_05673, partial [Tolypocladium capitatum]